MFCTTYKVHFYYAQVVFLLLQQKIISILQQKPSQKDNFLLHRNVFYTTYKLDFYYCSRKSFPYCSRKYHKKYHFLLHRNVFCTTYKLNFYYCSRKVHGEFHGWVWNWGRGSGSGFLQNINFIISILQQKTSQKASFSTSSNCVLYYGLTDW